ncbi:unnamed protein product [Paramecium sonneborni]|uniref:Uncharacterized protein n=1 Tax=Paramecium sonneborni TaxID=65129 RepID=A0A8S1RVK7_9CILI|nr:unnamed protein product [Paramecium sonneborni]
MLKLLLSLPFSPLASLINIQEFFELEIKMASDFSMPIIPNHYSITCQSQNLQHPYHIKNKVVMWLQIMANPTIYKF